MTAVKLKTIYFMWKYQQPIEPNAISSLVHISLHLTLLVYDYNYAWTDYKGIFAQYCQIYTRNMYLCGGHV